MLPSLGVNARQGGHLAGGGQGELVVVLEEEKAGRLVGGWIGGWRWQGVLTQLSAAGPTN